MLTPWKERYDQPREHLQKQRYYFINKGPSSQGYGFSSSHVEMTTGIAAMKLKDAYSLEGKL